MRLWESATPSPLVSTRRTIWPAPDSATNTAPPGPSASERGAPRPSAKRLTVKPGGTYSAWPAMKTTSRAGPVGVWCARCSEVRKSTHASANSVAATRASRPAKVAREDIAVWRQACCNVCATNVPPSQRWRREPRGRVVGARARQMRQQRIDGSARRGEGLQPTSNSGLGAEHSPEEVRQLDHAGREVRAGFPPQRCQRDLRPFVAGAPPLDEPRVEVHDPILSDAGALVDAAFGAAVAGGGAGREELDRQHGDADVAPAREPHIGRLADDEEIRLDERAGAEHDVGGAGQQLELLAA